MAFVFLDSLVCLQDYDTWSKIVKYLLNLKVVFAVLTLLLYGSLLVYIGVVDGKDKAPIRSTRELGDRRDCSQSLFFPYSGDSHSQADSTSNRLGLCCSALLFYKMASTAAIYYVP